jgi:hypothetical protein
MSAAEDRLATLAADKNTAMVVGALAAILEAIEFAVRHAIPYARDGSAKEPDPTMVDPDAVMEGPQQDEAARQEPLWQYSSAVRTMVGAWNYDSDHVQPQPPFP